MGGLVTTTVLNTKNSEVENKITNVSGLVKKNPIIMLKYYILLK